MKIPVLLRKSVVMLIGLAISAVGVTFSLLAELGTSPVACCPAVYSQALGLSVGTVMWLMCGLFILAQILILGREFQLFQLLQLPVAYVFGLFTDVSSALLAPSLHTQLVSIRLLYCACGIVLLAIGVWFLHRADFLMLAPDALMAVLAQKTNHTFSSMKVIGDCSMVLIAAIGSLLIWNKLLHVGIGTIAAALLVGRLVGQIERLKPLGVILDRLLSDKANDLG